MSIGQTTVTNRDRLHVESGREFVGNYLLTPDQSTGTIVVEFPLNPRIMPALRLQQMAGLYDLYRVRSFSCSVTPSCPSTVAGSYIIVLDPDPKMVYSDLAHAVRAQAMSSTPGGVTTSLWLPALAHLRVNRRNEWLICDEENETDFAKTRFGNLALAIISPPSGFTGQLSLALNLTYTIEFKGRSLMTIEIPEPPLTRLGPIAYSEVILTSPGTTHIPVLRTNPHTLIPGAQAAVYDIAALSPLNEVEEWFLDTALEGGTYPFVAFNRITDNPYTVGSFFTTREAANAFRNASDAYAGWTAAGPSTWLRDPPSQGWSGLLTFFFNPTSQPDSALSRPLPESLAQNMATLQVSPSRTESFECLSQTESQPSSIPSRLPLASLPSRGSPSRQATAAPRS